MAVLKQTSPTAWPSAPRPKPSSTVPSASTRSAVGLWSGQAASFSDVVMSALHSRDGCPRQSRKRGDSHAFGAYLTLESARWPALGQDFGLGRVPKPSCFDAANGLDQHLRI